MVAAQKFKLAKEKPLQSIYGVVTNGNQWQFLKLSNTIVTIDFTIYPLPPVERILAFLVWMIQQEQS